LHAKAAAVAAICDIVMIISNHPTTKPLGNFIASPLTNPNDKRSSEGEMFELLGQDVWSTGFMA
jgi:hypothetical protein